ncbi:MAG: hypothetical protein WED10_03660 [Brumimicrobium sp.]
MNLRLSTLFILLFANSFFAQEEPLMHNPCFNDEVSAFSGIKLGSELILCIHDLTSSDSLPSKLTRSTLVQFSDSCEIEEAMLFHKEKQEYASLNVSSNTGPASISKDGKRLFLSNTYAGKSGEKMGVFVLEKSDYGWLIQQEFPFNSPDYSVMHPTYDEASGKMFFTSDKNSHVFNLWYVDYDGKYFGDSIHQLSEINAIDANDVFPYFHDNILYFSTDRDNYTYLNFYEAELLGGKWDARTISDSTFISGYDDFGLTMVSERTGFFASTRNTNGKKDELIAFRNRIDCSQLPAFSTRKMIGETEEELNEALGVIEEFRNVFGAESELTYKLNVDFIQEQIQRNSMSIADFYCTLFNHIDSVSLAGMDYSLDQSLRSEKLVDSLFTVVSEDLKQEIVIDSLIRTIEKEYEGLGLELEMEEQRSALKEAYDPLKHLSDSLVQFSDTLRKALAEKLAGFIIEQEKLPDFAKKPNGLFFAIQVGALGKKASKSQFANLSEVIEVDGPTGLYHYITGFSNSIDKALKAQAQVRGVGYPEAFIVAYCDGERIPLFKAKELIASGECIPLAKSKEPNIDYTVLINRPGTDKPFTVEIDPDYNKASGAVEAVASETREGLFFTVQIGVYDEPVPSSEIYDMPDLITALLPNGQIRYSSGRFNSEAKAKAVLPLAAEKGIPDAFIAAYYKGKRIPVSKARLLLEEKGDGILEEFD